MSSLRKDLNATQEVSLILDLAVAATGLDVGSGSGRQESILSRGRVVVVVGTRRARDVVRGGEEGQAHPLTE